METTPQKLVLQDLRARIGRWDGPTRATRPMLPFRVVDIDDRLPEGGLALGALHEVNGVGDDMSFGAAPSLFIAGILARLPGPVLWCVRRRDLFAPGLACVGLDPDRIIFVEARNNKTVLLAMEEGLKHAGLAAVVGEIDSLGLTPSRRLQLAAESSAVPAFTLRRMMSADTALAENNAAVTRWLVHAIPSPPASSPGIGRPVWKLSLLRCRGGQSHQWIVEACDAQGFLASSDLRLPAELADRQVAAEATRLSA